MLIIRSNLASLNAQAKLNKSSRALSRGFERLSSGLRINGARDDAAGLQIATRMTAQLKGARQSVRNANDGVSYLQTAEGALNETTNILQRMRELVVQSGNEILGESDRVSIQEELNQLKTELNRINESTQFNGKQVFSQHKAISVKQSLANGGELNGYSIDYELDLDAGAPADFAARRDAVIENLKSSWLREAETLVEENFGLSGNGGSIRVTFDTEAGDTPTASAAGGVVAFVSSSDPQRLHIDLHDFSTDNQPNGGNAPQYSDRIIAHEFVHIAMNATGVRQASNSDSAWFNEGAAELLHGAADTRLRGRTDAQIATMVTNAFDAQGFNGNSIDYGGAYIAAAYLHDQIVQNGGTGIKELFGALQSGTSFNDALSLAGYADRATFDADFLANGATFGQSLRDQSLATGDTGSAHGSILGGGSVFTQESILANESFQGDEKQGGVKLDLQVGGNAEDELSAYISSFNSDAMGIAELNIVDFEKFDTALYGIDDAIHFVSNQRSKLGALNNRLESTMNSLQVFEENTSASRSRIMDADFAAETAMLTRSQITQQASTSILAQANGSSQIVLSLLS
jgi:flagellin